MKEIIKEEDEKKKYQGTEIRTLIILVMWERIDY